MKLNIKPLSVNRCWQGRRFKTPEYTVYEHEFLTLLTASKWKPVLSDQMAITLTIGLSNSRADIDNIAKPVLDILQKQYGFNDSHIYRLELVKKVVKKGYEYVDIALSAMKAQGETV